jgi:amidohydrolase
VLVNDEGVVGRILAAARRVGIPENSIQTMEPIGGGEDFAYYGQTIPAGFAFLGARNDDLGCNYPHHHARFNIDASALPLGAALLAEYALGAPHA